MISTVERVLFLKGVDFFDDIESEMLVSVAKVAKEQRFEEGEQLLKEGDRGDALYLIVEGRVSVHTDNRVVAKLGESECIGEMSLLDSEPRSATVIAEESTLCLRLDQKPFFDLLAEHPALSQGLIAILSRRLRAMLQDSGAHVPGRMSIL